MGNEKVLIKYRILYIIDCNCGGEEMAKIMVVFPDKFLSQVDDLAKKEQRSRSELIREALRHYFKVASTSKNTENILNDPQIRKAINIQENTSKKLKDWNSTKEIRKWRDRNL